MIIFPLLQVILSLIFLSNVYCAKFEAEEENGFNLDFSFDCDDDKVVEVVLLGVYDNDFSCFLLEVFL